jgi:hypothetical protein
VKWDQFGWVAKDPKSDTIGNRHFHSPNMAVHVLAEILAKSNNWKGYTLHFMRKGLCQMRHKDT